MKAIDTSVLVAAELRSHPHHARAKALVASLAEGPAPWAIPWPCVYEFLRVATHPRVFHPPLPADVARRDLAAIFASPSLVLLGETDRHAQVLAQLLDESPAGGNLVQALHVAALCREHGVGELYTADLDLMRFVGVKVTNPFA